MQILHSPSQRVFLLKRRITVHRIIILTLSLIPTSSVLADEIDLSGRWRGTWQSETTGHSGPLNGRFRKLDDSRYRVWYTGRFAGIVPFFYPVTMNVVQRDCNQLILAGSTKLGPIFGTFEYSAVVTPGYFDSRFQSKSDSGRFQLHRVR
jgi:hypothetical protein